LTRSALIRSGLALLIVISSLLAASTWRVYGHTWDEPEHLAAGLELLDRGKYEYDTEHPPIARVLIALGPYLAGSHSFGTPPPSGVQEGIDILYDGGHYDRTLTLARLGALPFLTLLLLSMWLWAREVAASHEEALLAVALLASVPPIIGHAALAALDVPGTATTLLALYFLQRWLVSAARRDSIMFGATAGVAVGTKLSAVPFIGLGMIVLGIARFALKRMAGASNRMPRVSRSWGTRLIGFALMVMAGALPIILAYGRRSVDLTELPPRFAWVLPYLFDDRPAHAWAYAIIGHLRLPEACWDFAEGIMALKAHNDTGHVSFLFGHLKPGGWWYFYLVDLAAKTPLPLLATGPAGLVLLSRAGWREHNAWRIAPAVLFLTLLAFASFFSRINIGIRHVLILYPFLALGGAYALARAWRGARTARDSLRETFARAAVVALVLWQLSTWWTANPDYFPYFNELVRHPEQVLTDSDLDWGGQDLHRLRKRLAELHVQSFSFAYQGTADLAREQLPKITLLPPWHPTTGWVAITALSRAHELAGYAWLNRYAPLERVGKAIDLYFIPQTAQPGRVHREVPAAAAARCVREPAGGNNRKRNTAGRVSESWRYHDITSRAR
jgi:Dolichyl-phosphate-mannose-protein mannosyltransferase